MNKKLYSRFYVAIALLSWSILLFIHVFTHFYPISGDISILRQSEESIPVNLFLLSVFLFYRQEISTMEYKGFIELLWRTFITGGTCLLIFTFSQSTELYFPGIDDHNVMGLLTNLISFAMVSIFVSNTFFMFKRMALYNRTIHLERYWAVYEYIIFFLFIFNFFSPDIFQPGYYVVLIPISIYGLILSFNVKWVAYLNSKLKWRSLLLMFLLLAMALIFAYSIFQHSYYSDPAVDPARLVFLVAVLVFIVSYSVISHLVVLFNLPTSSVFEQKFEEVMSVQRLSESFLEGKNENEMYGILAESSMATVLADGCWVEEEDSEKIILLSGITVSEIENVKSCLNLAEREGDTDLFIVKSLKETVKHSRFKYTKYASLVMLSLNSQKGKLARIYLVKEVKDGFDLEMVNILRTYVAQAAVSIENLRLLEKALENERYATELVTAREVQKRLLPSGLIENNDFSMVAFCRTSEEMGGDYYDYFSLGEGRFAFVLGDVSGKGTSAAFNLAQVKGIFQALVQLNLPPIQFMAMANGAIGRCLEKSSFVTLTYCLVNTQSKTLEMVRAGHCPALIYSSNTNYSSFYRQKGLGLGILRGRDISSHLENVMYSYAAGDVVLLYSDGLSEARNLAGEEYGYDRIKAFIDLNATLSVPDLQEKLIKELEVFTDNDLSRDDLSFMLVKFKNFETSPLLQP